MMCGGRRPLKATAQHADIEAIDDAPVENGMDTPTVIVVTTRLALNASLKTAQKSNATLSDVLDLGDYGAATERPH
jgi:hypothetical protein